MSEVETVWIDTSTIDYNSSGVICLHIEGKNHNRNRKLHTRIKELLYKYMEDLSDE